MAAAPALGGRRSAALALQFRQQTLPHPWMAVVAGLYMPVHVRYAPDRCCVCDGDTDHEADQFISCSQCAITVHQGCYGVTEMPEVGDAWVCR